MSDTLLWTVLVGLLIASFFVRDQWKRYRIRHDGTRVMAKVTQVRSWREASLRKDISPPLNVVPLIGG